VANLSRVAEFVARSRVKRHSPLCTQQKKGQGLAVAASQTKALEVRFDVERADEFGELVRGNDRRFRRKGEHRLPGLEWRGCPWTVPVTGALSVFHVVYARRKSAFCGVMPLTDWQEDWAKDTGGGLQNLHRRFKSGRRLQSSVVHSGHICNSSFLPPCCPCEGQELSCGWSEDRRR
jgi:hypothetical protein